MSDSEHPLRDYHPVTESELAQYVNALREMASRSPAGPIFPNELRLAVGAFDWLQTQDVQPFSDNIRQEPRTYTYTPTPVDSVDASAPDFLSRAERIGESIQENVRHHLREESSWQEERRRLYSELFKLTPDTLIESAAVPLAAYQHRSPLALIQTMRQMAGSAFLEGFTDYYPFVRTLHLPVGYEILKTTGARYSARYGFIWHSLVVESIRWEWAERLIGSVSFLTQDGVVQLHQAYLGEDWSLFKTSLWGESIVMQEALADLRRESAQLLEWSRHVESNSSVFQRALVGEDSTDTKPTRSHIRRGKQKRGSQFHVCVRSARHFSGLSSVSANRAVRAG